MGRSKERYAAMVCYHKTGATKRQSGIMILTTENWKV